MSNTSANTERNNILFICAVVGFALNPWAIPALIAIGFIWLVLAVVLNLFVYTVKAIKNIPAEMAADRAKKEAQTKELNELKAANAKLPKDQQYRPHLSLTGFDKVILFGVITPLGMMIVYCLIGNMNSI